MWLRQLFLLIFCQFGFKITFAGTTVDIKDIEVLDGQKVEKMIQKLCIMALL